MADRGGVGGGMEWGRGEVDLRGRVWYHVKVLQFRPMHTFFCWSWNRQSIFPFSNQRPCALFCRGQATGRVSFGGTATAETETIYRSIYKQTVNREKGRS